jgi:hypothetical protein
MSNDKLTNAAKALLAACDKSVFMDDYLGLVVSKHDAAAVNAAIEALREALEAAPAEPVGWKLVPERMSDEMASALGDASDEQWRRALAAAPAAPAPEAEPTGKMTHQRAKFFMQRFMHEEKMLGPNEQEALRHAIAVLEEMQYAPAAPALPVPVPENYTEEMGEAYTAGFFDGLEQAEQDAKAAPAAPAPEPLTQAQRIRLWNNSPQVHGDVVGRDAFERLVKLVESVHCIAIAASKGAPGK